MQIGLFIILGTVKFHFPPAWELRQVFFFPAFVLSLFRFLDYRSLQFYTKKIKKLGEHKSKLRTTYPIKIIKILRTASLGLNFTGSFNPIQDGGQKGLPTSFSPVTSTNTGIRPQNFLTFSFNSFWQTGVKLQVCTQCQSRIEPRPPLKKSSFSDQILIKLRLW